MATEAELCTALKQTLDSRGALDGVRARLRADVFAAIQDDVTEVPPMSREQLL